MAEDAGVKSGLSEKAAIPKDYAPRGSDEAGRPTSKSEKAGKFTMK